MQRKFLWIGIAVCWRLTSCTKKQEAPPQPASETETTTTVRPSECQPGSVQAYLQRLAALDLPGKPDFQQVREMPVTTLQSRVLSAKEARDLWQALWPKKESVGLYPFVMEDGLMSGESQIQADEIPKIFKQAEVVTLDEFVQKRRENHMESFIQYLASTKKVARTSLPKTTTYPELARLCKQAKIECPDKDELQSELDSLKQLTPDDLVREEPDQGFAFVQLDEELTASFGNNAKVYQPLKLRVVLMAAKSHELPAYLGLGGWNECPFAHEHVAILRDWNKRFGAELMYASHDTFELFVSRPPKTLEDVRRLAWEQLIYCEDIVYQGVGSTLDLARALANNPWWYFWWD